MNTCIRKISTVLVSLALAGLVLVVLGRRSDRAQPERSLEIDGAPVSLSTTAQTQARANHTRGVAPFILTDTATDSPGTNLVTRVVTMKAQIQGSPPLSLQWKVDKGGGFVPVSANATNSVLVIANASVADTGRYALFATNTIASTNTTPVPLVVVEGVD